MKVLNPEPQTWAERFEQLAEQVADGYSLTQSDKCFIYGHFDDPLFGISFAKFNQQTDWWIIDAVKSKLIADITMRLTS